MDGTRVRGRAASDTAGETGRGRRFARAVPVLLLLVGAAGCSTAAASGGGGGSHLTLRLGYFPNITHATALVGVREGIFAAALGPNVTLQTSVFPAGPAAVTALFSGAIDASYVGPNPAINAWAKSHGQAIRIISGATSGGAALVVQKSITSVAQLRGKTLATPQLGNTQDVALRYWLSQQGLRTDPQGGGDVHVTPAESNSVIVQEFRSKQIAGAWVPEPYASQMVVQGHGHVLVNERSLWPGGAFPTTLLVVRTAFLQAHPGVVAALLKGQVEANDFIKAHPAESERIANEQLKSLTGKALRPVVLKAAFADLTFTDDPIASSLLADARHAESVGLLKPVNLTGIFDLGPLNQVLAGLGQPQLAAAS